MMRMMIYMMMIEAPAFIGEVYKASLELFHYFIVSLTLSLALFNSKLKHKDIRDSQGEIYYLLFTTIMTHTVTYVHNSVTRWRACCS